MRPAHPTPPRFVLGALLVAFTIHTLDNLQAFDLPRGVGLLVYNGLLLGTAALCLLRAIRVSAERLPWALLSAGMACFAAGDLYFTLVLEAREEIPYPSLADIGYLGFYPFAYAALALVARRRLPALKASLWLDGLVGALTVAAVAVALVFGALLEATDGSAAVVATNLAYPLGDLILIAIAVSVVAMTGWQLDRTFLLLLAGFVVFGLGDSVYLLQSATGTYEPDSLVNASWGAGLLLLALAAWQPAKRVHAREGLPVVVLPVLFALASLGLLVIDHFRVVETVAVALATTALVAVLARLGVTFRAYLRALSGSQEEAATDALTGLSNRRQLLRDLEELEADAEEMVQGWTLALFDLDGFKTYNDRFGHPAGDELLARLGRHLAVDVETRGRAYRLGGDEFCVLTHAAVADAVLAAATSALAARGKGFEIGSSNGRVELPEDARTPEEALRLADQRMYAEKQSRRGLGDAQMRAVLLQALNERSDALAEHADGIGRLAGRVATRLGLHGEAVDEIVRAAELRDLGKMAIPDAVLAKPGPLTEAEWALMRTHSLAGERILAAAPALRPVARLVRSSHERWDGAGYPDALAREAIPVGARIILACDALHAMVSERAYRPALSLEAALAELERCAGTQFDPGVVEALLAAVQDEGAPHVAVPGPSATP